MVNSVNARLSARSHWHSLLSDSIQPFFDTGLILPFAEGFLGIVIVFALCMRLPPPNGRIGTICAFIGEATLAIYVAHSIFTAGVRQMLAELGILTNTNLLVLGTAVGLMVPAILYFLANRMRLTPYVEVGTV